MKKVVLLFVSALIVCSCSSTVIVKKETCKDIYGGVLQECERVTK